MEDLVLILTLIIAIGCAVRWIVFTWVLPFILKVCNFFNVVWAAILHGANFLLSISHWLVLAGILILLIKKAFDWLAQEFRSLKTAIQELKAENEKGQETRRGLEQSIKGLKKRCDAITEHVSALEALQPHKKDAESTKPQQSSTKPLSKPLKPNGQRGEELIQNVLQELKRGY